jgi:hypothetical protein
MDQRPSWIGRTLSARYRIEAMLGQGGTSAGCKATGLLPERVVAISLFHPIFQLTHPLSSASRVKRLRLRVSVTPILFSSMISTMTVIPPPMPLRLKAKKRKRASKEKTYGSCHISGSSYHLSYLVSP